MLVCFYSRENPGLARAEVMALKSGRVVEDRKEYCVVDGTVPYERLVMTRFVGKVLKHPPKYKTFQVRVTKTLGSSAGDIVQRVAAKVKGKVDLKKGSVVRVFVDKKKVFVTEQVWEFKPKKLACRKSEARPFFHPASLQPKLARLLLNLSGARRSVLDPFCGVGGILLEACDIGLKATGVEMDENYFYGCKENLWFFKCNASVAHADFLEYKGKRVEVVVTDLPYGTSSGLFGKSLNVLYARAFKKFHDFSSKCVVMGPKDLSVQLKKCGWKVKKKFKIYVHRTLTRYIHVCESY